MQLGSWGDLAMRGNVWKRIRSYWKFGICYAKCLGFCEGLLIIQDLNFGVRAGNSNMFHKSTDYQYIFTNAAHAPHSFPETILSLPPLAYPRHPKRRLT